MVFRGPRSREAELAHGMQGVSAVTSIRSVSRVNLLSTDETLKLAPVGCWVAASIRMAHLDSPLAEP